MIPKLKDKFNLKEIFAVTLSFYLTTIVVGYIIWVRLFRERISRDIPFHMGWIGFIILFSLCLLYIYLIAKIFYHYKGSTYISKIFNLIYQPLLFLEKKLLSLEIYKNMYLGYTDKIFKKISPWLNDKNILRFYVIFNILPRLFLAITLGFDIFINWKIASFYKYAFLTLLILFSKLIIHLFEVGKDLCIKKIESMTDAEGLYTEYLTPEERAEEYTEDEKYLLDVWGENRRRLKTIVE